jgi:8-oxo-dGTP pyrophosphatase MutT (NUDIX family)
MARQNLIALLLQHRAFDESEEKMRLETLNFTQAEERCMDAGFAPGHVTGSAWVVDEQGTGAVLLTHHRKLDRWFQLGGHLEPGETAFEGAWREAREESGLDTVSPLGGGEIFDVDVHPIPARGDAPAHDHYDIRFLFQATAGPLVAGAESRALRWVALEEAHRYNGSESILRMVRKSQTLWRRSARNAAQNKE